MSRLAMSRRPGESITLILPGGLRVALFVNEIRSTHRVRLVIDAPTDVAIVRGELLDTYERGEFAHGPQGYTASGRPTQTHAPLLALGPDSTDLTAPARAAACLHPSPSGGGRGQGEGPPPLHSSPSGGGRGQGEGPHPDASSSTISPCGRGQGEGPSSFAQSTTTPREGAAPGPPAVRHAAPRDPNQAAPSQGA